MAKNNAKKKVLKSAQKAANSSTLNAVARNKQKGASQAKGKSTSSSTSTAAKKAKSKKVWASKASTNASSKKSAARAKPFKPPKAMKPKEEKPAKAAKAMKAKASKPAKATKMKDAKHSAKYNAAKAEAKQKKTGRGSLIKKAVIISAAIVILVFGCCCAAFAAIEDSRSEFVPETTILDGQTDVSGMTEPELRELLTNRAENEIATTITLNVGDVNHQIRFADIGSVDIDATVEQAFAPYHENPVLRFFSMVSEALMDETQRYDISTACIVNPAALNETIKRIAADNSAGPKNAGYAYDGASNALVVTQAKQGVIMDVDGTIANIEATLSSPSDGDPKRLMIQAQGTIADPESYEPGQAIFVDTRNCFVHLYENGTIVATYPCTPGTSGYATPTGDFYLSYKDGAPTWYNPHSAWAEGMPETIGPGPSNPLGVRALAVSCGDGIFIHGTTSTGALGAPGSHGCVRLSNENIIKLYDRVSQGIPIIIR